MLQPPDYTTSHLRIAVPTGIALSLLGVLTIILRGDPSALAAIRFNLGDLMMTGALIAFGLYSALMLRRPVTHQLSLICFTMAVGALLWCISAGLFAAGLFTRRRGS